MTWTNIPDPATLPSNINANTPRQGNDNAYRDHHTHHNNLAAAVKELVTHVDGLANADGPRRFDIKTVAQVTGGIAGLSGTNPRIMLPNGQWTSTLGPNDVVLSGDKILVVNYVDAGGMFDWSKTGIYTVGGTGMSWVRDTEQPREWTSEFPGDVVVASNSSIVNFAEFRAVNLGAPGLTLYITTEYAFAATLAANAIGETYYVEQGQFSDSFDSGAVALVNSVLADGGDGVPYTPGNAADWDTEVTTVGEALDVLANRVRQLEL